MKELLETADQGLLEAHEASFDRLMAVVSAACLGEREWPLKVRAAIGAALTFAAEDPEAARLLTVDGVGHDPVVARRAIANNARLADLLSRGRDHRPQAAPLPPVAEEVVIGGISSIVSGQIAAGDAARLPALQPDLVELALTPYLGSAEAARIATEKQASPATGEI